MRRVCPLCQTEYNTPSVIESIIKDFPDKKDFWLETKCPNYKNHYDIVQARKVAAIPREMKQKVLDLMWDGKSIGEICKELNLELDVVCGIVSANIRHISILNTEVKEETKQMEEKP